MRKKQAATRHVVNGVLEVEGVSQPPKDNLVESTPKTLPPLEPRNFTIDPSGNIVLADGTPVVQPAVVEDTTGFSGQLDMQDGALPFKSQTIDSPGVLDTVKCTSCASRISPFSVPCEVHPVLKVIICKRCLKFYGKGDFPKDDFGKDENCRWCGDGGDLICCDSCSNTFCKSCIRRNIGRTYLHSIEELGENESWNCLLCTKEPLLPLQRQCFEIIQRVRTYHAQRKKRSERAHELWRQRSGASSASTPTPSVNTAISSPQVPPASVSSNRSLDTTQPLVGPSTNISAEKPLQAPPTSFSPPEGLNALAAVLAGVTSTCGTQLIAPFGALPQTSDLLAAVSNLQALASVPLNPSPAAPRSTLPETRHAKSSIPSVPNTSSVPTASKHPEIQALPANKNQSSGRGKWGSASNPNSSDWYLENVTVAGILDQISQVQASNIRNATKALRACLETFLSDLRRVETNLSRARTLDDITNIVRSFQSIFRFHFFSRIGNLVSRLQDDPKQPSANSTPSFAVSPTPNGDSNDRCKQISASEPTAFLQSPESSSTVKSNSSLTIDLTDEGEPVRGSRSQATRPPSIPTSAAAHLQVPIAAVSVAKTASVLAASSRSPPTTSTRPIRKRPVRRKRSPVNTSVTGTSINAPSARPVKRPRCVPSTEKCVITAATNVVADAAAAAPVVPSEAFSDLIEPAATDTAELETDTTACTDLSSVSFLNSVSRINVTHSQASNKTDSSAHSCPKASQSDNCSSLQPASSTESGPDTDCNGQFELDSSPHQSEAEKENNADAAPPVRQSPSRRTVDSHHSVTDDGDQNKTSSELSTAVGIFSESQSALSTELSSS
uniref:PHD-type domain-containing protein n=1 Tax=Schistocephalus solidus TaxID=70667 RepID=A0A0X3PJX7_SCHSO